MTPPAFEIRRLHEPDAEQYRRIRLSTLSTDPDAFGASFDEEATLPLSVFASRLASSAVFGACTQDGVVGTMLLRREARPTEAHKAVINGVFVEPAWRQRGVASVLMAAVLDHARAEVEQVTLTVMQGNDAAMTLYRRFGFTIYGVEPRARRTSRGYVDQVLMVSLF